ncbi:MAG: hypothetical protein HGA38_02340 [Candidatus Moranbacteria bacterium]|nr:hypothetical protein [Candidatus Moranbacteria bacterium]
MQKQPTALDKAVKISIVVGALIVALSIAYYLVVYIPKRDKAKTEQQNQQYQHQEEQKQISADNLAKCLKEEATKKLQSMQDLAEFKRKGNNFDLETSLNNEEKAYQERKADCFKKYPQ